jgi:L-2-hydroxyglutarate oxidase LhgO
VQLGSHSDRTHGVNTMTTPIPSTNQTDVVLVGAGIMSATLAVILKELDPSLKIEIYEVLGSEAQESSNAWNNAGTGHAALCELNYTPQNSDGSIDISKALQVNTEFDLSRQLWAYLVKRERSKIRSRSFIPFLTSVSCADRRITRFLKNASRR